MRIAVHGFISDGGGSSAGAFRGLLATLLEQGHEVDFYGIRRFTEPRSLEVYPRYRYIPISVGWNRRVRPYVLKLKSQNAAAVLSVLAHIGFHKEAVHRIETSGCAYDFILCLDTLNLWPSRLPVVSWPQAPPHTEWAALRVPEIARAVKATSGRGYHAAVQLFYLYRYVQARLAYRSSDRIVCGSRWALEHWLDFGVEPSRMRMLPYPIELGSLEHVPVRAAGDPAVTFLWLGRSVPRKRLDLFLGAFDQLRIRHPAARALLVGQLAADPAARPLLDKYAGNAAISVRAPTPRTEVPALFAEAHVLVQPSQNENFGFSIAEALGAGRPIVAGPTNGTAAYAGPALYGFHEYSVEAVAEAMERAYLAVRDDPVGVANAARAEARSHFVPEAVAHRLMAVAAEAIAGRAAIPAAARSA
jgi:glycosyltransferase involved in cell wall biosynthesis